MSVLDIKNLTVDIPTRRGTLRALDDISLSIPAGKILGVVGESGAGKSMTGSAVNGLLEPPAHISAGEIWLDGRRIDQLDAEAMRQVRGKEIGSIFQDPLTSLNPLFTVGDQLVETLLTHTDLTVSEARDRAIDLLGKTGIPAPEKRLENYPHQFSGGMRQRVVIALALAANPKLIIADEPTTALDVSIQAQIIDLLKALCHDYGAAVMLITHDMGVIAETADDVAVLYAGRLVEIGPVQEVIHRPMHPYSSGLMGAIPRIGSENDVLSQIPGAMPRLNEIPSGCAFHPRCPIAEANCIKHRPALQGDAGHQSACWKPGGLPMNEPTFHNTGFTIRAPEEMPS